MIARASLAPQQLALIELAESGVKFAILREPSSWEDAGDVDIIVSDMLEAEKKLLQIGYLCISSQKSNRKYIRYDWTENQWIHLDVQSTLRYGATEAPPQFIVDLLARSHFSELRIPYLDPTDEAILLMLHFAIDKRCLSPKYRERIFLLDGSLTLGHADSYSFLPKPIEEYLDIVDGLRDGKTSELKAIDDIRSTFDLSGSVPPSLRNRTYQRLRAIARGNPAIVFLGPDGSGKSTLTEPLARLRWPRIRCQFMGPSRESEMRRIFHVTMQLADRIRRRYPKKHPVGIVSRAAWQLICYLDFWDRLIRHLHFCGKGGVLVCDRYPCDMYFRKPSKWNQVFFITMFPRPRFVFLCVGDSNAIHQRKPELTPYEIENTIELYHKQLTRFGIPYKEINTTELSPDVLLSKVVQYLADNNWFRL